ncbi:sugar nucleotide-binding protein [Clostridiaceae bacterium M8S5]|nr:sugar nucleotide-binding protein [Clostridiaceae bacterium M8S5]
MEKVLVLGASGLIGKAIVNELKYKKEYLIYTTYYHNKPKKTDNCYKMDVNNLNYIVTLLDDIKPHIVISCLRGDFKKQLTFHTTVAKQLKKSKGKLYYCSTANVFDDSLTKPYTEYDRVKAKSEYGRFKIECEKVIMDILGDDALILRFPQVMSKNGGRMDQIVKALKNNEKIKVFPNLIFNTVTDIIIAKKLSYIITNKLKGIFHITASDTINHSAFYKELAERLGYKYDNIEEDMNVAGCFALHSVREDDYNPRIEITNTQVIDYLCENF